MIQKAIDAFPFRMCSCDVFYLLEWLLPKICWWMYWPIDWKQSILINRLSLLLIVHMLNRSTLQSTADQRYNPHGNPHMQPHPPFSLFKRPLINLRSILLQPLLFLPQPLHQAYIPRNNQRIRL